MAPTPITFFNATAGAIFYNARQGTLAFDTLSCYLQTCYAAAEGTATPGCCSNSTFYSQFDRININITDMAKDNIKFRDKDKVEWE